MQAQRASRFVHHRPARRAGAVLLILPLLFAGCGGGGDDSSVGPIPRGSAQGRDAGMSMPMSDAAGTYGPAGADVGTPARSDVAGGARPDPGATPGNTNISLGGAQDFGFFRRLLEDGIVPEADDMDAAGFFAEHHTRLPPADCGDRVCLQAMLGVMANLTNGENCTLLQLGLNSPITVDPSFRPSLTLAVVVDVSGSMEDQGKIEFVRRGLEILIDELKDGDRIALVTYESESRVAAEMGEVDDRRFELREIVRGLSASGGTNLHDGLRMGYQAVMSAFDSGRQNRVILVSDGQPTAGITDGPAILAMSQGFNSEGVGLTTVGLGTSFNVQLMRGLAEQGDGNFYFLEDSGAVEEVFHEELAYFTVPVAYDLDLEVETGRMYTFSRAFGSSLWKSTQTGGSLEVGSVFLAHRISHDDVTDQGGRRGGGSALLLELMPNVFPDDSSATEASVAAITVSYREPGSDERVNQEVVINYPFAPWVLVDEGYFEAPDLAIIHKSFVMLNIFVGMEEACRLFHEGNGPDGVAMLERLIAAVVDYNEELNDGEGDTDMGFDLDLLRQLRDVLVTNGATVTDEVVIPDDPWPAD